MARPLPQQPPPGVELSTVPTIRGRVAAHRWLSDVLGVPVSLNYVRVAAANGEIACTRMGAAKFYSTQALFDWITTRYDEATA
jgi:hypothetical protein